MPAAWERMRFTCKVLSFSGGITTSAKLPKPVLMPYTVRPSFTILSTTSLDCRTACHDSSDSESWVEGPMDIKPSMVSELPSKTIVAASLAMMCTTPHKSGRKIAAQSGGQRR